MNHAVLLTVVSRVCAADLAVKLLLSLPSSYLDMVLSRSVPCLFLLLWLMLRNLWM
jgi:hypothetical protein